MRYESSDAILVKMTHTHDSTQPVLDVHCQFYGKAPCHLRMGRMSGRLICGRLFTDEDQADEEVTDDPHP